MTEQASDRAPEIPPGPRGRRFKNLRERLSDCENLLTRFRAEYGDVVSWQLPGNDCCAVFDADLIHEILIDQRPWFPRILQLATQCPTIPNAGLARVNDAAHQRKLGPVNAVFSEDRLPAYGDIMIRRFREMADSWRPGQVLQAKEEMYRVVGGLLGEVAVGTDLNPGEALVRKALKTVKWDYAVDYLPFKSLIRRLPLPQNLALWRSFRELHEIVAESMRRAREPGSERADWTAHMVRDADRDPVDPPFTDEEIRDEVLDLALGGGVDTVALSLTWTLGFLCRNPAVASRLEQEVDEVVGERPMTAADFDRLPYARAVYHEALRLGPPPFFIEREATEDRVLGGRYLIRKGTLLQLCRGIVYRDDRYFDRTGEFAPERWMNGGPASCPAHVFMPFSAEPRRCPAWQFNTMAGVFLVATIARSRRLQPASDETLQSDFKLLFAPKGPVPVRVTEREGRADQAAVAAGVQGRLKL